MSALPPKADIETQSRDVRFVPKADITNSISSCALSPASSPSVDKAAVRDRRKLFVVAPAAAPAAGAAVAAVVAGAAAPAADAAVAAVAAGAAAPAADASVAAVVAGAAAPAADAAVALVDVAVWRPRDHLARRARIVLGRPVKAGPAAAAGAERAFGRAKQAQVAELWSPCAVLREAAPARWQRREQSRVHAPADPMAPPESKSSSVRPAR